MNRGELRKRISRRQLLCGVGGVSVALPLLGSLSARADALKPPKRLILVYTPNGVIRDAWWPLNASSETAFELATESLRIHGGVGYTTELPVERYYRDAPLMIIGEGTNEIQRLVIARGLLARSQEAAR